VFTVGDRTVVGIGQKSGVYHVFDATTGQIVWQRQTSIAQPNGGPSLATFSCTFLARVRDDADGVEEYSSQSIDCNANGCVVASLDRFNPTAITLGLAWTSPAARCAPRSRL